MRSRRSDVAHRCGAADRLDLDVRQQVRGDKARDDRDARSAAANAWTAMLSSAGRATRGPDPAAPAGVPDDAEPGAGRAVAYPGLLGEPGQGDFMITARQAVARCSTTWKVSSNR